MSEPAATLRLVPLDPPLVWIHPAASRALSPASAVGAIDLRRDDHDLAALIRSSGGRARLEVPIGPFGEAFARVLRHLSSAIGVPCDVQVAASGVDPTAKIRAAACANDGRALLVIDGDHWSALPFDDASLTALAAARRAKNKTIFVVVADVVRNATRVVELAGRRAATLRPLAPIPILLAAEDDVGVRLRQEYFGILPCEAYDDGVRRASRRIRRALCPEKHFAWLAMENLALLGADPWGDALRRRFNRDLPSRPPSAGRVPRIIAICGTDGSGKSTHVAALAEYLNSRGLRVRTLKLYRHGIFHDTVTDLNRRSDGTRNLDLWRIERLAKVFDSLKYHASTVREAMESADVLVFDRWTQTHFAASCGRTHWDPFVREFMSLLPPADLVFWLDAGVEKALASLAQREHLTIDENPYMIGRFHHGFRDIARRTGMIELDGLASFAINQQSIREHVERLLSGESP